MHNSEKIDAIKKWIGTGSINIFGRPLAGKDYQGQQLAKLLDGNLIIGGDILRGDNMPDFIKENMKTGELTPTEDYKKIVLPYLNQSNLIGKPLILSSVGRWHGEEEPVIKASQESGHPFKIAIYLDIPDSEVYVRIQQPKLKNDRPNRHDDSVDLLKIRFDEFNKKTLPVIDYYRNLNMLIEINATQSREKVTDDIISELYNQASHASTSQ